MEEPDVLYCEPIDYQNGIGPAPLPVRNKEENVSTLFIESNAGKSMCLSPINVMNNDWKPCRQNSSSRRQVLLTIAVMFLTVLFFVFLTLYFTGKTSTINFKTIKQQNEKILETLEGQNKELKTIWTLVNELHNKRFPGNSCLNILEGRNKTYTFCFMGTNRGYHKALQVYIKSEGCDDADIIGCGLAVIKVNGKDYAKKVRGHNIVVVNADTGIVETSSSFDTFANVTVADKMANFLNTLQKRKIVLIAIQDESSHNMNDAAYNALIKLGAVNPLKKNFRSSYVQIGWTGPGQTDVIAQVQNPRYQGPSIIAKVIPLPQ